MSTEWFLGGDIVDEKQRLIMDIAQGLFDERGLKSTSIGDIVRECKISKATFYKYFSTKENLVYELIVYFNNKFLDATTLIDSKKTLSEREKLNEKIKVVWKHIYNQTLFTSYITDNLPRGLGEEIRELRKKARTDLIREYYNSLIKVYGEEIKEIIWDVVFILDALIHEFIYIIRNKKEDIETEFIAEFIMNTLDITFNSKKGQTPLIKKGYFYFKSQEENKNISNELLFERKLLDLKEKILESSIGDRSKLLEAAENVSIEFTAERYSSLTIDAMLALLEKEEIIKEEVSILYYLKEIIEKERD